MNKESLARLLVALLMLVMLDDSKLFAETYQWTDADGSVHFSDSPPANAPGGKHPVVQRDETSEKPPIPSIRSSAENSQPSGQPSWMPDSACLQELKDFDKNAKEDENIKRCTASVMSKSRQKYSPKCLKQLESKKYTFTPSCQQEMQTIGQEMVTELQQCTHMESRFSPGCREQLEKASRRMQEAGKICGEATQKIIRICGTGQAANEKCYNDHRPELETACSGK